MPTPVRVVYARPRTFISIAIGIVAFFLLPDSLRLVTRLLIGWDIFVAFYLAARLRHDVSQRSQRTSAAMRSCRTMAAS